MTTHLLSTEPGLNRTSQQALGNGASVMDESPAAAPQNAADEWDNKAPARSQSRYIATSSKSVHTDGIRLIKHEIIKPISRRRINFRPELSRSPTS